jgi:diadenosine tetraphosphate (Ap4A) HIT family hydrolase
MLESGELDKASAKFRELDDFIRNRMRMSHVYQPAMLIELLRSGGSASVETIAKALLSHDQSQIEYYEQITKNMVGDVLSARNGITEKVKAGRRVQGFQIPGFEQLEQTEVEALISSCESKIAQYIESRGERIWSHRRKSAGYVSGTLQYEVLKRAKFRCELCGILDADKALEVDHIVPRNHGGTDDISNLQALCYSCNAMKRDRDDADLRGVADSYHNREADCVFCEIEDQRIIASNALCYAIRDKFPVTEHHTLIIPKRHVSDFFGLYQPEINAAHSLVTALKNQIEEFDHFVAGFNVGINSGEAAGQTIFHCHIHLIPRRKGDMEDPRGGVRGVIPERRMY